MDKLYVDEIKSLFLLDDFELKEKILSYHPYEISEALLELSKKERRRMYSILSPKEISYSISFLEIEDAFLLFNEMVPKYIVNIIQELDIDDAVDLMQELDESERAGYLKLMDAEHRENIKELLKYKDDTAGSIMNTEYINIDVTDTVATGMKKLLEQAVTSATIYTIYVTNKNDKLLGTLSLREMILARKNELIEEIMNKRVVSVETTKDQEEVAAIFMDYDFTSLPVVDKLNRLLGVITVDDVLDVIEEETLEDYSKFAAISDAEIDSDTETVLMGVKKRLPWLLVLSVLGFFTSTIIAQFEGTLDQIPTIALFMPMILGMAGNTGTQSLAVTVRGLNDGEFQTKASITKHLLREIGTGFMNGILIGIMLFGVTYLFLHLNHNPEAFKITQVVSLSIMLSLAVSTLSGALIPIIINSFKIDPAVASGPFVTMINDILALSVYFTLATMLIINTL
ncbi:magnesium transporter [Candidatus Izimaplasma bacterium ZiA1]|uniref:magnesium transporter n=1 Tax=Candidatus Izimoplasma sp. ZiA1 TaxID=2024899 RepID=UPI000BAA6829|nr:magnesium transporter [Candidatus Izimaplasma bacterium ZiA1]